MKPYDVTKFIKFYKARDSVNQPKTGRNYTRFASFLLLSVFPPWLVLRKKSFVILYPMFENSKTRIAILWNDSAL